VRASGRREGRPGLPGELGGRGGQGGQGGDADRNRPVANAIKWLIAMTAALYVIMAVVFVGGFINAANQRDDIAQVAEDSTRSICALRADLKRRVKTSKELLLDNPNGLAGLPPGVIVKSINDQQRTIDTLRFVDCPPDNLGGTK
jgi:hypothetical protein